MYRKGDSKFYCVKIHIKSKKKIVDSVEIWIL